MRGLPARSGERGQALVELALVLPVFLLLILGTVEFGRAYSSVLNLNQAAREGARLAATGAGDQAIVERVAQAAIGFAPADLRVTISPAEGSRQRGQLVRVEVTGLYRPLTPIVGALFGSPFDLRAEAVMQIE